MFICSVTISAIPTTKPQRGANDECEGRVPPQGPTVSVFNNISCLALETEAAAARMATPSSHVGLFVVRVGLARKEDPFLVVGPLPISTPGRGIPLLRLGLSPDALLYLWLALFQREGSSLVRSQEDHFDARIEGCSLLRFRPSLFQRKRELLPLLAPDDRGGPIHHRFSPF